MQILVSLENNNFSLGNQWEDLVTGQVKSASSWLVLNFLRRLTQLKTEITHVKLNGAFRYFRKQVITDLPEDKLKTCIAWYWFDFPLLSCGHSSETEHWLWKVSRGRKEKSVSFWTPKFFFIHLCQRVVYAMFHLCKCDIFWSFH